MSEHPNNPNSPDPNSPDREILDLDTAISADLDGELAAYAAALGREPEPLLAELRVRPEYSGRRTELEAARDALQAPPEALDEVTRRRLLAGATAGSATAGRPAPSQSGRRAWTARLAAAAAVLVVVLGVGTLLVDRGANDADSKSATIGGSAVRQGNLGDLGDISDPATLDRLIGGEPGADSSTADSSAALRVRENDQPGPVGPKAEGQQSVSSSSAPAGNVFGNSGAWKATPDQVKACAEQYGAKRRVRFTGTGVYQDQAAVVVGLESGSSTIVFVLAAADCNTVLFSVSR